MINFHSALTLDPAFDAWIVNTYILGRLNLDARITTTNILFDIIDRITESKTIAKNMKQTILHLNDLDSKELLRSRNTVNKCKDALISRGYHYITADTEFEPLKPLEYDRSVILRYLQTSELPEDYYR